MTEIVDRVQMDLVEQCGVEPGSRLAVAVSGGPDSVALLHILHRIAPDRGLSLAVAHVHHGLRGQDADDDARFVTGLAGDLCLPVRVVHVDVRARLERHRMSLQMAAREARMSALEAVARDLDCRLIALGHHRDDQAETVLMRVITGAGTDGLAGIRYRRGVYIHPLLGITKKEIEEFLAEHGIDCREDTSNRGRKYLRNRIRHDLLPLLADHYNPRIVEAIAGMAKRLQLDDDLLSEQAAAAHGRVVTAEVLPAHLSLSRSRLLDLHPAIASRVLLHAARQCGVRRATGDHVARLLTLAQSERPRLVRLPDRVLAERCGDQLVMCRQPRQPGFRSPIAVPGQAVIEQLGVRVAVTVREIDEVDPGERPGETEPRCWLDADSVSGLELGLRRPGYRLRPLGMSGTMTLKKFMIDRRIPRVLRGQVPLLLSGDRVVWVVGHRISDDCRVGPDTRRVLQIVLQPQNP